MSTQETRYPVIGYKEFIKLYKADEVSLIHSAGAGGSTSAEPLYLLAMRDQSNKAIYNLARSFAKAHDLESSLQILGRYAPNLSPDAIITRHGLSEEDYFYTRVAIDPTKPAQTDTFISVKDEGDNTKNFYVQLEPEIYDQLMRDAREKGKPILEKKLNIKTASPEHSGPA